MDTCGRALYWACIAPRFKELVERKVKPVEVRANEAGHRLVDFGRGTVHSMQTRRRSRSVSFRKAACWDSGRSRYVLNSAGSST